MTPRSADIGLALGHRAYANGAPSNRLLARLDETLRLYQAGSFRKIVVSDSMGQQGRGEEIVMKRYPTHKGIAARDILVDSDTKTTYESEKIAGPL